MSFILDALKKLEQKRQEGSVPDIMTVHLTASQEPGKRSLLPYIIVLVLLINAGILATLLLPGKQEKQEVVPVSLSGLQESAPASSGTEKLPAIAAETSVKEVSPVPDSPSTITAAASVSSSAKEQPAPSESIQPRANTEEPLNETMSAPSVGLNPSPQEMELLRMTIKEEYASIDDSPPEEILTEKNTEPVSENKVLEFDQLPSDIKKELPAISIKGHIYSNSPSSRIVNVNGIIIREGDTVTAGLKVEEINMTGVIFDYGGLRFRIRAF